MQSQSHESEEGLWRLKATTKKPTNPHTGTESPKTCVEMQTAKRVKKTFKGKNGGIDILLIKYDYKVVASLG